MNIQEIGKRIKISRKNAGLTQEELARKIGKTESSIRKYEKGLTQIPFDVLESIAQALNVSPYDLTMDSDFLQSSTKTIEGIQVLFGAGAVSLLENYDSLNDTGKKKANEYVADLTEQPKYKKEPPPGSSGSGSESN